MSENIYIHYGSDKFEKELFMSIVNWFEFNGIIRKYS